jgi:hypothetical protein
MAKKAAAPVVGEFVEFESSNIHSGKFDPDSQVIIVRFQTGGQYEYPNCNYTLWEEMNKAWSCGKFVYAQLSKKPYTKVEDWK